jgi:NAD(P)-dependent dehydrogenase (short-subunit alcohol dehydrogenase family)
MHHIFGEEKPSLKCNLIAPGFVRTPMTKEYWEYEEKGQMKMARVSDVVDVVLRLCADQNIIGKYLLHTNDSVADKICRTGSVYQCR